MFPKYDVNQTAIYAKARIDSNIAGISYVSIHEKIWVRESSHSFSGKRATKCIEV